MITTTTVTSKGQVTIPRYVRKQVGIKPGDKASFIIDQARNTITISVRRPTNLKNLGGSLHVPGLKYVPLNKIRENLGLKQQDETWI